MSRSLCDGQRAMMSTESAIESTLVSRIFSSSLAK